MSDEKKDAPVSLWESAQAAIGAEARGVLDDEEVRRYAKVAVVAVLRQLSDEVEQAEEDETEWPDSGDLWMIAQKLEDTP